mmetsp:Transcript_15904/g.36824  ORF Transcript_15904/g.36824 Transcript_15904/m.36824 type:complete len:392 (-) Transcript_15904:114-1289(-)|eukprot:CAMPEP_0197190762 /NCGR_PEP_ID=MMETSP1423-20130617/22250_1 /TAXON_ID=476441 /ORGANISM="Pseudo-nitzschia heimii, Strain UNC1101" /LENGTH=391 /DNA_ID=CAMNT_0042643219 /DNA_START=309 /DNA_END=1484 /DNA_ORIENTATION=+
MKFGIAYTTLACLVAANCKYNEVAAFTPHGAVRRTITGMVPSMALNPRSHPGSSLHMSEPTASTDEDDEIARLKAMAQQLRAEAASLEAEQAEERSNVARIAFEKFDDDSDGNISVEDLKKGLENSLKTEISQERVQKLMDKFDVSGDGYLQLEEMVSVDQFRNQLEAFSREEKRIARDASMQAQKEKEEAQKAEAKMALLNDKEPTNSDKFLSILPYLFPLFDSLQFGRYFFMENADNLFLGLVGLVYAAYRSIPFSGFAAFIALNTLSNNPGLNKLIRFNMQQAIFVDIALFFPGLLAAIIAAIAGGAGVKIPEAVNAAGSTAIFAAVILTILYASISSALGIKPDKIPIISDAVEDRMPTIDMFDDQGRYVPRNQRPKDDEKNDEKKD